MNRHERVARGDHDRLGAFDRLDHTGGRTARVRTVVAQRIDVVLVASSDEPLLERERPRGRDDVRPEVIVRRGKQSRFQARGSREPGGNGRERLAATQGLGAHEVEPEVAIAEHEPPLPTPRAGRLERLPRLAVAAPATFRVIETGERIEHRVEVGRNVQAQDLEIVAHVPDHRELPRGEDVVKPYGQLGATDAARETDDPHDANATRSPWSVRTRSVRAPIGTDSRLRSVSVSTSCSSSRIETGWKPTAAKRAALPAP